jgi:pyruvate dehydrogenase E2 component (dihydrolipoamide acetyltransferase)
VLAEKRRIDVTQVAPTGPYGRIIERDVAGFVPSTVEEAPAVAPAKAPITAQAYEDIAFTGIRRAISKSMTASLRDIPQLTHNFSFDASAMLKYRETLKTGAEKLGLPNITLNDMILFAVSRLLKKHPDLNAHMPDSNTLRRFSSVNLGMAVDTTRGLLVPVIKNADTLSLSEIAIEAKRLAKAAQDGNITPDEMGGGTFTVSNLGSFGVESFTPVINPPQTGILGVNNIVQRVKETDGAISVYPAMSVSLTYDHRAVDGAPASRFGKELCDMLAQFPLLLAI